MLSVDWHMNWSAYESTCKCSVVAVANSRRIICTLHYLYCLSYYSCMLSDCRWQQQKCHLYIVFKVSSNLERAWGEISWSASWTMGMFRALSVDVRSTFRDCTDYNISVLWLTYSRLLVHWEDFCTELLNLIRHLADDSCYILFKKSQISENRLKTSKICLRRCTVLASGSLVHCLLM